MEVKVLEVIDYTLKRKGDRIYQIVDANGQLVNRSGSWRSLTACKKQIQVLGLVFTGVETVNQNYSHWADFVPVKEGRMMDDEQ